MDVNMFLRSLDAKAPPLPVDDDDDASVSTGTHKASLQLFSTFLQKRLLVDFTLAEIGFYVECIDIDRDGQIGKDDLEIFIKRGALFSKTQKASIYSTLNKFDEKVELYPKKPLSEEVLQMVLAELRIVMRNRRLTPYDLFQKMDENKDGFVTIDEICQRLDEIISLPQEVKEGFFSCIDRLKIGIIDYNSFLRVMNKSAILKEKVIKVIVC